jgi:hypothetical protein
LKIIVKNICFWISIFTILHYLFAYLGGRYFFNLDLIFMSYLLPIILILIIKQTIILTKVIIEKNKRIKFSLLSLLFGILLLFINFIFPSYPIFQIGFRNQIKNVLKPEQFREIAHVSRKILTKDDFLPIRMPGPGNNLWNAKKHAENWKILTSSTAIERLDNSFVIFVHDSSVSISWGGALWGHWGVKIYDKIVPTNTNHNDISIDIKISREE